LGIGEAGVWRVFGTTAWVVVEPSLNPYVLDSKRADLSATG
jgi:hypothetical protein